MTLYSAKIADLGKIVTGKTPSTKNKENFGGNIPFITPVDMSYNRNVFSTERYVSSKGAESVKGCILPPKTVCVSCIGSDMGKSVITTRTSVTNQQINSVIVNEEHNYMYVYYLMRTLENTIKSLGKNGTAVPILSKSKFSDIDIQVHDLESQCRIAKILSAYDDLIENNQKQIKLLEEAAQRLYKEWFVDLRFPGYENTPITDGVPEGWEIRKLDTFGEIITGKTPSTAKESYYNGDIPFVKIPDMHNTIYPIITESTLSEEGANTQKNKFIPKDSLMVSCIATVGLVNISIQNCQTNQQINSIILESVRNLYYLYFSTKGLKMLLDGVGSNGATMTNVNKSKFANIEVLYPTTDLCEKFYGFCKPIFEKILILSKSTIELKNSRDQLLPKLMSGELEV